MKYLALLGSTIWILTAIFHATGLEGAIALRDSIDDPSLVAQALHLLWISPTIHWIFLSVIAAISGFSTPTPASRVVVALCAAVLLVDAYGVYSVAGWFPGVFMLMGSAAVFLLWIILSWRTVGRAEA